MKNVPTPLKRHRAPKLAFMALALAAVALGQADEPKAPIPLDPLLEIVGKNLKPADFAKRYPDLKMPRFQVAPEMTGFTRVSRAEGRGITLFGISANTAYIGLGQRAGAEMLVHFVARSTGLKMSKGEFEKRLADCTAAVTSYVGAPYLAQAERSGASRPGAIETHFHLWPGSKFKLAYSYSIEDPALQLPFRAEYIRLDIGQGPP